MAFEGGLAQVVTASLSQMMVVDACGDDGYNDDASVKFLKPWTPCLLRMAEEGANESQGTDLSPPRLFKRWGWGHISCMSTTTTPWNSNTSDHNSSTPGAGSLSRRLQHSHTLLTMNVTLLSLRNAPHDCGPRPKLKSSFLKAWSIVTGSD
jgi:hypothetical protein